MNKQTSIIQKESYPVIIAYVSKLGVFLILMLGIYIMMTASSCNNKIQDSFNFTGQTGGHEGPPATAGPPMDPESWHIVPGTVLGGDDVWGHRVNARTTFKIPGGMGLLYSSHPGPDKQQDSEWRSNQIAQGLTTGPSGSLAFTRDLFNWYDYPGNPVLNEVKRSWQTPARVHTRDMFYDPENKRWVAYFSNIPDDDQPETSFPGVRVAGLAYSKDLVNWEYSDGPILTIEDYAAMVPERIEATEEELNEYGRVYPNWAMHHNGRYYLTINGTETVGEHEREGTRSLSVGQILVVGESPEGPFEHVSDIEADNIFRLKPLYWNEKWYTIFADTWDGQPGFGLAWSDDLFGPYTYNIDNPIIAVESTQRSNPMLFNYEGIWGVLFSQAGYAWEPLPLRLAITNIHPSLLMPEVENSGR